MFQLEKDIVDICFTLLDVGERRRRDEGSAQRQSPVAVCRTVAAMVRRAGSSPNPAREGPSSEQRLRLASPTLCQSTDQRKPAQGCSKHLLPIPSLS